MPENALCIFFPGLSKYAWCTGGPYIFSRPEKIYTCPKMHCVYFFLLNLGSPTRALREPRESPRDRRTLCIFQPRKKTHARKCTAYIFSRPEKICTTHRRTVYILSRPDCFYTRRTRGPCIFFPGPTFYTRRTGGLCIFFPGTIFFYKYAKSTKKQ